MTHAWLLATSVAGFAALALATERQQEELLGRVLTAARSRLLRATGWLLLGAALLVAVRGWGWGFTLVAYCGHLSLAAGVVYATALAMARRRVTRAGSGRRG
jgi:hypothetical protein